MVKVSVIIPVYNVENYLKECLDSVCRQSLKDIEIICINDGSTDNSLNILKDYQKQDNRLKIFSQNNYGPGNARNVGMDNADGEYILFIDSDDYIRDDVIEQLYNISKEYDADFTLFKLLNFDNNTGETNPIKYFDIPFLKKYDGATFNRFDLGEKLFNVSVTSPGKLFKRNFIDELRFPENIQFEDTPFIVEAIFRAEKMFFVDEYFYMRRVRQDSITRSNFARFSDCIEIFNMVDDISKKYDAYDDFKELLFFRKYNNIRTRFLEVDEEYKKDFFDKIKRDALDKRKEVQSNIDFNNVNPKAKQIYSAIFDSKDYAEFELSIKTFKPCENDNYFKKVLKKLNGYF